MGAFLKENLVAIQRICCAAFVLCMLIVYCLVSLCKVNVLTSHLTAVLFGQRGGVGGKENLAVLGSPLLDLASIFLCLYKI